MSGSLELILMTTLVVTAALAAAAVMVTRSRGARPARGSSDGVRGPAIALGAERAETAIATGQHELHAEKVDKVDALGRRAGDIAHDLNDLLTVITGHTELLIANLAEADSTIQNAYEIRGAVLSAKRLTRQLLALSRYQGPETDVIDVNAVVGHTADLLRRMLGDGISVTLALDANIKHVRASARDVEEIVLNLALNARDAMPDGGRVTLTTTMHSRQEPDAVVGPAREHVRLVIADTGRGIPEDLQSKVFEPFLTPEGAGGSAIGLAKVYRIVTQRGGHIRLDSTAGVGTTFTVDLPATAEAAVDESMPRFIEGYTTVLVVEDDPRVRELIKLVLVRAGHEVVVSAGPHEALAALHRQTDINVLLIDVVMPEMNGYDLAAEARKLAPRAHFVFMSGFARDAVRQRATDGFLAKPFTVESLTCVIQQALGVC